MSELNVETRKRLISYMDGLLMGLDLLHRLLGGWDSTKKLIGKDCFKLHVDLDGRIFDLSERLANYDKASQKEKTAILTEIVNEPTLLYSEESAADVEEVQKVLRMRSVKAMPSRYLSVRQAASK